MPSRSSGTIAAAVAVAGALLSARAANSAEALRATVQRVDGTTVELDVGRRDGVVRGARFTVFTLGKVIRIPLTNTVTYKEGEPVAVVRVLEISDNFCRCIVEKREVGATISIGLDAVLSSGPPAGGGGGTGGKVPVSAPRRPPPEVPATTGGTGAMGGSASALRTPTSLGLAADPSRPAPGQEVRLAVTGMDGARPGCRVRWSAGAGGFSDLETSGPSVTWTAPRRAGDHEITAVVTLAGGKRMEARGLIGVVGEPAIRTKLEPERVIGYRGFDGDQPLAATDVAFDPSGKAYVLDARLRYVVALPSGPGVSRKTCADAGLRDPRAVAVGGGKVFVLDSSNPCVKVFSDSDTIVSSMGERRKVRDPVDVAVDSRGFVYVVDRAMSCFHIFNDKGAYLHQRGGRGTGAGQFVAPVAVEVAPNGNILVLDKARRDVQVFDPSYSVIGSIECRVSRGNELLDLAVAPNGETVQVLEGPRSLVATYAVDGKAVTYPARDDGTFPDLPAKASKMAVGGLGRIHVMFRSQRGIYRYQPDGSFAGRFAADPPGKPMGVAVGDNGRVAVLDAMSPHVRLYDSRGWMTMRFAPTTDVPVPFRLPRRIAITRQKGLVATLGKGGGDGFDSPDRMASLHVFDSGGNRVRSLGQRGTQPGEFLRVVDLDADREGDVYALDRDLFRISVFASKGVGLTPERERQLNRGARLPHELAAPERIAVDPDTGDIYIYDGKTRLIKKYTKDIVYIGMTTPAFGFRDVQRMRVGHLGFLWAFDQRLRELRRIDFRGNVPSVSLSMPLGELPGGAKDFGLDARGRVYVLTGADVVHVFR
ncbi:MAG: 6-bladed beta-propeller [Planctomycetota bacterium]|jgi:hypothetical protein